ncbi:hypothetical protein AVEN_174528-1, partial [Araneus ventricosus]
MFAVSSTNERCFESDGDSDIQKLQMRELDLQPGPHVAQICWGKRFA